MKRYVNKEKVKTWIKRYLPAEIVCTLTAMFSANITYVFTQNGVLTAIAGTWGENIGFYGVIIGRDIYINGKNNDADRKESTSVLILKYLKKSILEFGPAEILDSFFSRPFMMYIFPIITGNIQTGIFAGKIVADLIVYIPVIVSYELQQRYAKK